MIYLGYLSIIKLNSSPIILAMLVGSQVPHKSSIKNPNSCSDFIHVSQKSVTSKQPNIMIHVPVTRLCVLALISENSYLFASERNYHARPCSFNQIGFARTQFLPA